MTSDDEWWPDHFSVLAQLVADDHVLSRCLCGAGFHGTYDDFTAWRRTHRCPPGSVGAWPKCPDCGSTSRACVTVNETRRGRGVAGWHKSRLAIYEGAR